MTIDVYPWECNGCGLCERVCPEVFACVPRLVGRGETLSCQVPPALERRVMQVVKACPTFAIVPRGR